MSKQQLLWVLVTFSLGLHIIGFFWPRVIIRTFDQDKITSLFVKQLSQKNLSDEVVQQKTTLFSTHLRQTLNEYSKKNHLFILKQEAILAGQNDATNDIIKLMAQKVRHE